MDSSASNKVLLAVQQRKCKVLSRLLDDGASVDLEDSDGNSLLILAAKQGQALFLCTDVCANSGVLLKA